ncbi:hypothetical protein L2E82_22830 [Cichorium intybus]|uniref:Uncharacterized protein n=1 Tax=Cichorium intybus TaxID=13427 RepID=A0ACB9DYH5_CICIN|nr:hypothetical protein L2E82_22830 [Cichorium intybus]
MVLGERRKRCNAKISKSGKPHALMKISRKRRNVIPIGIVVCGYKKAHKHQHKHGGLKKKSRGKKSIAKAVVEDDNAKEVEEGGSDDNDSIAGLLDRKSPGSDRRSQIEFECNIDSHKIFLD